MLLFVFLYTSLSLVAGQLGGGAAKISIDGSGLGKIYDGHGALSAGASSRLLYDYSEPYRSDILDLLFKPKFGASLHLLKVEIGGDVQSTDGTEASHKHTRDDLSCSRGYEWWLMQEARKRNNDIVLYALSWGVPFWVGNQTGYYCQDNIDYHLSWLSCFSKMQIGSMDYVGNWNERSWGPPDWTVSFRKALDTLGFQDTAIIIPDGSYDRSIVTLASDNATFKAALRGGGVGLHYPCNQPHPEVQAAGLKYWSSEDYSTVGDWAGAGCWGRLLNQNFVRMNMTSTIAWSLIWSVNNGEPYYGNGLMYAYEPWSNWYTVNPPVWTTAHTTQFSEVGWTILDIGVGSGDLPGGGSYVTMVSPNQADFTVVMEKLEGKCLRCAGQHTTSETVVMTLVNLTTALKKSHGMLHMWQTNSTAHFQRLGDIAIVNGIAVVTVQRDSVITLTTTTGQEKGKPSSPAPPPSPFPLPYTDDFETYPVNAYAKYFADDGGSFQVAADPTGRSKQVLKQWVISTPGANAWVAEADPVSVIAAAVPANATATASVDVYLTGNARPVHSNQNVQNLGTGQCLDGYGATTKQGDVVDTYSCMLQWNEQWFYSADTGTFTEAKTGYCLSFSNCTANSACARKCNDPPGDDQVFDWHLPGSHARVLRGSGDGTIRLRSNSSNCLTAISTSTANIDGGDDQLLMSACDGSIVQMWQHWASSHALYGGLCIRLDAAHDRSRNGYCFFVVHTNSSTTSGQWQLWVGGRLVRRGLLSNPAVGIWHSLSLRHNGNQVVATLGSDVVASVQDSTYTTGFISINS
eukprot:CAMPEP_0175124564 /NCGR_PEP_ID=MMETSP0087-20121206/2849_1 /TAXON_ID=136419 /ORGANISM="Unknown Unknown, Strain D1" /LENGTH=801 /DNA_ID=CAMNT_0016406341 /DNA_START=64 /DNA_END=2466 /DNA_ORIENTATION=-